MGKRTIFQRLNAMIRGGHAARAHRLIEIKADSEQTLNDRWKCSECGGDDLEMFMVSNEVWEDAGMAKGRGGFLHLKCVEKRIGRKLERDDFLNNELNRPILFGYDRG